MKCLKCGRELTNENSKYVIELRGYVGPTCFKKMNSISVSDMNKKAKEQEKLVREIWGDNKKAVKANRDLYPRADYASLYDVPELGTVLHQDLFEDFDLREAPEIDPFSVFEGLKFNLDGKKCYIRNVDEVQRTLNMNFFLNHFKNPMLGSSLDVFNNLGIRLAFHCKILNDKDFTTPPVFASRKIQNRGHFEEVSFIICADNSPFPERFLWVRQRYIESNVEATGQITLNVLTLKKDGKMYCTQAVALPPVTELHKCDLKIKNAKTFVRFIDTFFSEKNPYEFWEFFKHTRLWQSVKDETWKQYPFEGPRGMWEAGNTQDSFAGAMSGALNLDGDDVRVLEPNEIAQRWVRKKYKD